MNDHGHIAGCRKEHFSQIVFSGHFDTMTRWCFTVLLGFTLLFNQGLAKGK